MTSNHQTGSFVVLEGLDGAGTTTQSHLLTTDLAAGNRVTYLTREPTDHPLGRFIREAVSERLHDADGNIVHLSERALCLLFAADRFEHSRRIDERVMNGVFVVSDRYLLSSIAYQSLDAHIQPSTVIQANAGCRAPDLTVMIDVKPEECMRRLAGRGDVPAMYEKQDLLERIDRNYRDAIPEYEQQFGPVVIVDGHAPVDTVRNAIADVVAQRLLR